MRFWLPALLCIALLAACGGGDADSPSEPSATATMSPTAAPPATSTPGAEEQLVVANSTGSYLSLIDPATGEREGGIQVGPAPHRIAVSGDLGYVTSAAGLTIFNVQTGDVFATLPYQADIGPPTEGEFREGGMGLAVSADGTRIFVGVYTANGSSLEVFHNRNGFERSIPIGNRPFDVILAPDGGTVYSIDHDSYTLTAVDTTTWEPATVEVAPLGQGAYDKPHYGAIAGDELLLPFQGRTLLAYNLESGATRQIPLTANTHQHGIAVTPDGTTAVIVGTGPAGDATEGPSLTILSLADGAERIIPLERPHELVAFSSDGRTAYLTGGYLLEGGWDGITVVDLESGDTREFFVPDRPLGIVVLAAPAD